MLNLLEVPCKTFDKDDDEDELDDEDDVVDVLSM